MIILAYLKALGQLTDSRIIWIMIKVFFAAVIIFISAWIGFIYLLGMINWQDFSLFGFELATISAWLVGVSFIGTTLVSVFLSWLIFPTLATILIGFFTDDISEVVEDRHYPYLPIAKGEGLFQAIMGAISFFFMVIGINLILLPIYGLTLLLFGFGAILYFLVNGWIFGREYFDLVAARRYDFLEVKTMRRKFRLQIWGFGILLNLMILLPFVGAIVPVIATAAMTHLLQFFKQDSDRF